MFESELWRLSHLLAAVFMVCFSGFVVAPAIADVVVGAVCDGKYECSLALYLTGFQQAITGLGGMVMMPVLGYLSDIYGRKKLLLIPLTLSVIPSVILAWRRTTNFFYTYYAFKILTGMITESGVTCLSLAYLADNVSEGDRISAFGLFYGIAFAASLFGTFVARFLSTPHIFQVAACVSIAVVVYTIIFVKETNHSNHNSLQQPILASTVSRINETDDYDSSYTVTKFTRRIPSPKDVINLLKSSTTFSLLACVSFFKSLADMGIFSFLPYFLKARFHFKKDQFAEIFLITSAGATLSNMFFLPMFGHFIGEDTLLIIGLFADFLYVLLNSIAWSAWIPYALGSMSVFYSLPVTTLRSMVSKQIGPNEQGIAQGCILAVTSVAYVVSPLIFTPLSAIFMGKDAPINFTGLSMFCIALAYLIGVILSIFIKIIPRLDRTTP